MVDLNGEFIGFSYDYSTKKFIVSIAVESTSEFLQTAYDNMKGKLLDLVLKIHRKKRSLDANAYYWQMLTQLAEKMNVSNSRMHNTLLREYGVPMDMDGQIVYVDIADTEEAFNEAIESETFHIKPTSEVHLRFTEGGTKAELVREYVLLKGSSKYDTKEMSRLINGLIEKCHEAGISTISDEEAERMINAWKAH